MTQHIAIAGATGAVGTEFLRLLELRNFSMKSLKLLASARSAGRKIDFRGESLDKAILCLKGVPKYLLDRCLHVSGLIHSSISTNKSITTEVRSAESFEKLRHQKKLYI